MCKQLRFGDQKGIQSSFWRGANQKLAFARDNTVPYSTGPLIRNRAPAANNTVRCQMTLTALKWDPALSRDNGNASALY